MITIDELIEKYKGTRVVIVGNGKYSSSHDFTNYEEKCGEPVSIWTINGGQDLHNSDLEFRMDDLIETDKINKAELKKEQYDIYVDKLKNPLIPVFVSKLYNGYNSCIEYPLKKILTTLLKVRPARGYFAETTSYAVLFAIYCGVKQIDFYGTDYIGEDRPEARNCTEYWAGVANGLGIITTVHEKCNLLKTTLEESHGDHFKRVGMVENFYGYTIETLEKALKKAG